MSYCNKASLISMGLFLLLSGCGGDNTVVLDDAEREAQAILEVKKHIQTNLDALNTAVVALCAAAPAPDADGWNATADGAAVEAMRSEWRRARIAYESVEGALAVVFPELDYSLDARYDAFIETTPDIDLFDDTGVTGMHAVERVLWSDAIPEHVLLFESALPNYKAAAFPQDQKEATSFKNGLCARMVADVDSMRSQWKDLALTTDAAYYGAIGSMGEQAEKVFKAATGEEESRYARFTLGDMRANVAAGKATYAAFKPWVLSKDGGADLDRTITEGFASLEASYATIEGDALPEVPAGWTSANPPKEMLETPFGKLFVVVEEHADTENKASLVSAMTSAGALFGAD